MIKDIRPERHAESSQRTTRMNPSSLRGEVLSSPAEVADMVSEVEKT